MNGKEIWGQIRQAQKKVKPQPEDCSFLNLHQIASSLSGFWEKMKIESDAPKIESKYLRNINYLRIVLT
jgi:hypothetical protein